MQTINIPQERVPVLLGTKGRDKRRLEKASGAKFEVDSEGEVRITSADAVKEWRARDIVMAVGRGFSPDRALMLIDEECYLKVIDLRGEFSDKDIERVKGRVIGEKGRTRQIIEDTSDAYICVYGHTISILGKLDELTLASRAIEKLMDGAMHTTVYKLLDVGRRELKRKRAMLWEEKPLTKG